MQHVTGGPQRACVACLNGFDQPDAADRCLRSPAATSGAFCHARVLLLLNTTGAGLDIQLEVAQGPPPNGFLLPS
jgi:hypothetical protein